MQIIQQCAINFQDEDIIKYLIKNDKIVKATFAHYDNKDVSTIKPCLITIGQFIALSDKETHKDYISTEKYDLLKILLETLQEGSLSLKKDALWVLQSLACDPVITN
jgi:hypothetical protein